MPSAGQTTDAARITSVLVKVGDKVKRGDTLVEAETDKAVLPVESYLAGTVLEILVKEGDDVTSGDVLMMIGSGAAAPPSCCRSCGSGTSRPCRSCRRRSVEEEYTPSSRALLPPLVPLLPL